jgi:hypothetical protein
MKKFIIRSLAFLLIFSLLVISIKKTSEVLKPISPSDYMAAIALKHARVAKLKSPKLILAGGSNLAFGIDSRALQEELSMPVANMGLHGGLGLSFILKELEEIVQEGDVVILSIEYYLELDGLYKLKKSTSSTWPEASEYYSRNFYFDLIDFDFQGFLKDSQSSLKRLLALKLEKGPKLEDSTKLSIYTLDGFNSFGDLVSHLEEEPPLTLKGRRILKYRFWEGIPLLNKFNEYASQKNIKVFFLFPNFPASEFAANNSSIDQLYSDIKQNLTFEILNKPEDAVLPDSLFFDTVYHLNKEGRVRRTEKLIGLLKHKNFHKEFANF